MGLFIYIILAVIFFGCLVVYIKREATKFGLSEDDQVQVLYVSVLASMVWPAALILIVGACLVWLVEKGFRKLANIDFFEEEKEEE